MSSFLLKQIRWPSVIPVLQRLVLTAVIWCPCLVRADWQLYWSDEFDGNSINANNWTFDIGNGSGGWGNNELEYYTSRPENVYVSDGLLHIVARQESYGGRNYTSAKLKTSGLFSKKYGRFEFRAKLPQGQGYWPALWMMPQNSAYGGWASSGEIDVMENKGRLPANVLGTIHFGGTWPNNVHSSGPSYNFPAGDSVTNFHTYAVEWTTNAIRWYVDDHLFQTQTSWWSSGGSYPAPFDQAFYIIMNLAIGGNFDGNPDGTTIFPQEMQVDYVRVYNLVTVPPPPPVLKLKFAFDDSPGSTTTTSDTNDAAAGVRLQMANGAGVGSDYHGATNSGVVGMLNGSRALDFTFNGTSQPGTPGPIAAATNSSLGFGVVSNFVATVWIKQNAQMANGANIGPRIYVMGAGNPADAGANNSIGLKFQSSSQLYFQMGGVTTTASFPASLPTNIWLFIAVVYDGENLRIYQGTDTNPASLISNTAVTTNINFGASAALYIGNRQDRQRSFNGWIDGFRFYTGVGDANFLESIRQLALSPANIHIQTGVSSLQLVWPTGTLQSATNVFGPWNDLSGVVSPYDIITAGPQQFYRIKFQ
ncbi:MAG: family 16 glycosylhydrolase [Limisphaerales bacterium]